VLVSLSLLLLKQPYLRILGFALLFVFVLNNGIEIFSLFFYKNPFNVGMALSFLSSNAHEGFEMASGYWFAILVLILYYVLICYSANTAKKYFSNKLLLVFFLLFIIFPAYLLHIEISKNRNTVLYKKTGESDLYFYMKPTPVNTLGPLMEAYHYLQIVKKTSEKDFKYPPFKMEENNIQNLVVVLGESARRNALGLYGSPVNTTPYIEKRIPDLLIYNNAVSPGEFTNLALSLILSNQIPDDNFSIKKMPIT
jgi:glucan phosphoethanolaminetransferase (alkaline phosphatase superfamily)